ncbi:MAG: trans-o-hydroxybenzylidenepyruvate hydratase-aldolase, partial [bacterium]
MIEPWDLRGVLTILPTPAKDGADRWDATDTVNLDETARLVEQVIRDGAGGIIALGTMGECSTLAQADYEKFVDCVLATVRRRVPTFIGATALGTHEVVRRIRMAKERGAEG